MSVAALLPELRALRAAVAAVGMPDEGMRGTAADSAKAKAAADAATVHKLGQALEAASMPGGDTGKEELAEVAAAVVRSIAITPESAMTVCGAVADGLCAALWARRGLQWVIASTARLAQHAESHARLLSAGVIQATLKALNMGGGDEGQPIAIGSTPTAELSLVACILLAFLSESEPTAAALVPPGAIAPLVDCLGESPMPLL